MTAAPSGRARRLLGNIGAVALVRGFAAAFSFGALPFVIRAAGTEAYGLYALLVTITSYFALLDLGMGAALTKYVAEYAGRGDAERMSRTIASVFSAYAAIGVIAALGLLVASHVTPWVVAIPPALTGEAATLFGVAAVAAVALWPTTTFRLALEGLQRFRASAVLGAGAQVAGTLVGLVALRRGHGVATYLAATLGATLAANLVCLVLLRRAVPGLRLRLTAPDREVLGAISGFSAWMFVGSISSALVFQVDYLVVGTFIGLPAVTAYAVAFTLLAGVKIVDNVVAGPPWVAAAEMEGQGDIEGQRRLVRRGTRYVACLFLPAIVILIVLTGRLVRGWMGPGFEEAVTPARILLTGWLIVALWETGAGVATAKGAVRTLTMLALVNGGLNLTLSLLLARPLGLVGIALGTALPFFVVAGPIWGVIARTVGISRRQILRETGRAAALPVGLAAGLAVGLDQALPPTGLLATLALLGAVYAVAVMAAWRTSFTREDRALLPSLGAAGARRA